ncbi:MAG: 50S ribosomal protein L28 [Candidatus Jidaibacter sp.]|jgi:large subunit ribosomal protein L28|nr:50S ribosomal protein L28 [Candidatus Jidaibacter sp.]
MVSDKMTRACSVDGKKGIMVGNKVSHSNRKTRRRFLPNLQIVSFFSEILKKSIRLRLTPSSVRTIEHNDGIDNFLLTTPASKLADEAKKLKAKVVKVKKAASA